MTSHSEVTLGSMVRDGSDRSVQDIIGKLKFISKIKEGEIIDVNNLTLSEGGWVTSTYRTIFRWTPWNQSREDSLNFFRETVSIAFDLASRYMASGDIFFQELGARIICSLEMAKKGINNHTQTYKTDPMYVSKVEAFLETLDANLIDLKRRVLQMRQKLEYDSSSDE